MNGEVVYTPLWRQAKLPMSTPAGRGEESSSESVGKFGEFSQATGEKEAILTTP